MYSSAVTNSLAGLSCPPPEGTTTGPRPPGNTAACTVPRTPPSAISAALDVLRRKRETVDVDELPLASSNAGPEATIEKEQRAARVRQAVLELPEASRTALVLREYEGLSYKEIANTLGIPIGTVMSRLNYARTRLRKSLAPCLEDL